MVMTAAQCRAARALLGISQEELATKAGVAKKTLADFEREARMPQSRTLSALATTLERAGVAFVPENGQGPGVRLRYEWARPHRRDAGHWAVLVRWEKGAPLTIIPIEHAWEAADEAAKRGLKEIAEGLRLAAASATENEAPLLREALERRERARQGLLKWPEPPGPNDPTRAGWDQLQAGLANAERDIRVHRPEAEEA